MRKEEKTKLGISVVVLVAALFFSGMESNLIAIGLILYILVFEESIFARNCAKQMLVWIMLFAMLSGICNILELFITEVNYISNSNIYIPTQIKTTILLIKNILYFTFGIQTLRGKEIKIHFIDRLAGLLNEEDWGKIKKEINDKAKEVSKGKEIEMAKPEAMISKRELKYCKKCGQELNGDAQFCIYCGVKQDSD